MIKDNQSSLNRFHVVLDALVTAFSYLTAWFIVIGSGWAKQLGKQTLDAQFYFSALVIIVTRKQCKKVPNLPGRFTEEVKIQMELIWGTIVYVYEFAARQKAKKEKK